MNEWMSEQTNSFQQSAISDLSFIMWASSGEVCFIGSIDEEAFLSLVTALKGGICFADAHLPAMMMKKRLKLEEGNVEACHEPQMPWHEPINKSLHAMRPSQVN